MYSTHAFIVILLERVEVEPEEIKEKAAAYERSGPVKPANSCFM